MPATTSFLISYSTFPADTRLTIPVPLSIKNKRTFYEATKHPFIEKRNRVERNFKPHRIEYISRKFNPLDFDLDREIAGYKREGYLTRANDDFQAHCKSMPPNLIDQCKVEPLIGKASLTESYTVHAPRPYCPYRVLDVRAIEDSISEVCDGGLAVALQSTDVPSTVEPKKVAGAYPPPYTLIDEGVFQQSHHSGATCSWMSQEPLNRDVDYPAPGFRFHLSEFLATPEGGTKEYEFEAEKSKPFDPKDAHEFMASCTECEPEDLFS